jgi:hypothetical protein
MAKRAPASHWNEKIADRFIKPEESADSVCEDTDGESIPNPTLTLAAYPGPVAKNPCLLLS